jgi:hypothetical protein
MQALIELGLFTAKGMILVFFVIIVFIAFFMLLAKSKGKPNGKLRINNLNDQIGFKYYFSSNGFDFPEA